MSLLRRLILAFTLMAGLAPAFAQVSPPVPALPDTERRTSYTISNSTCACAVGFQLYGDSTDYANWIEVWINGVMMTQAGNWTLSSPTGADLSRLPRPITNAVLTFVNPQTGTVQIVGARRPRRTSQFSESRGVAARDLNQVLSDLTAQNRETWDKTNDITGRVPRVPPGETLAMLPVLASRANQGACFDNLGNLTSCVAVASSTFIAGNGISFTGTNPTTISTATYAAGVGVQFNGTNPTVISVSQTTGVPILSSRAVATTQDLSAYSVVTTLGYSTAGDGGGAVFTKVPSSTPFIDSYIVSGTTVGGSGYTNGTYLGVPVLGGSSRGCNASILVSGGAVIAPSFASPCPGFKVGDVLTTPAAFIGGTGSGFTFTVTAISTVTASFVDAAGTHWQYVVDQAGFPNILQFGCKADWAGADAGATNNLNCIQNALAFAALPNSSQSISGQGTKVIVPKGAFMVCGLFLSTPYTLVIPAGVTLDGGGIVGTTLVECATNPAGSHFIALCDSNAAVGLYGCKISNLVLNSLQISTSTTGAAAIYSNSGQQFVLAENVEVDAGLKGCIKYEIGKGGAANDIWIGIDCIQLNASNPAYHFDAPTAQHILQRSLMASPTANAATGIRNISGRLVADGIDVEGYGIGLIQNVTSGGIISSYKNVQHQSAGCSAAIQLASTNLPGNLIMENISTGCPITVQNAQSGGANWTSNVRGAMMCVSGACAAALP